MSNTLQPGSTETPVRGGIAVTGTGAVKPGLSRVPLIGRINRAIGHTSERWARSLVIKHLSSMTRGHLLLKEGDTERHLGVAESERTSDTISATIVVENPAVYSYIALNGVVGAAEAYMEGALDHAGLASGGAIHGVQHDRSQRYGQRKEYY